MRSVNSHPTRCGDRGQAIILFVGIFSVILVMAAVVVDFGLWFAERRSAQRGADLAAAAAAQDLPLSPDLAFDSACHWAIKNGFNFADSDVEVKVDVFARGAPATPVSCSGGAPTLACGSNCDTVRVEVSKDAPRLFTALPFFELPDDIKVGAEAVAGLTSGGTGGVGGIGADQTVLLVDAEAWMGNGCFRSLPPDACFMGRAQAEMGALVDTLAGSAGAQVGYAAYTRCYTPDFDLPTTSFCVPRSLLVVDPTSDVDDLQAAIDSTQPISQGYANICLPLLEAQRMFQDTLGTNRHTVILLSDGDSRYNHSTVWDNAPYPPEPCRPHPFNGNFASAYGKCEELAVQNERALDLATLEQANLLKNPAGLDVEIFVIGLAVCGPDDGKTQDSPGYCGAIVAESDISDNSTPDRVSDQRLLKCIASSSEHYFNVEVGGPWPFEDIASEIVSRSLLQ